MHWWTSAANSRSAIGLGGRPSRNGRIEESSRIAIWRIHCTKIERKSWYDTEARFTDTELFWRISRERIELQWAIFSRSQSTSSRSKSTICAKPRKTNAIWLMEFVWTTGKRFGQSTPYVRFITDTLSKNSSIYDSMCHRCGSAAVPVQICTGWPVVRGEERFGSTTTMPMSERRPSTMNSFSPTEIPKNSIARQQRPQKSELQLDKFPTPSSFSWKKLRFKNPGEFFFSDFSLGSYVTDQRSGDGRFGGWMKNSFDQLRVRISRHLKCWTR